MPAPTAFSYLDYRAFLRDWFEAKKSDDPSYSYAAFARDGDCSRSALANVIGGARTPRSDTLDAFARAMNLTPDERNYLGLLVELELATGLDARADVMSRILATDRFQQVRRSEAEPEATVERYTRRWYIPAIRELASLPGFRADPAWIASKMCPPISVAEAASALETLVDLDFVRVQPDGTAEVREVSFRTTATTTERAIARLHREEVSWILRHFDTKWEAEQHLVSATLSLPLDLLGEAKARVNALALQLANMADAADPKATRRVYQFSIQLLPVTLAVEAAGEGGQG